MASVSGSQLAFLSPNGRPVHLILSDDKSATTVPGAFNIEIFTADTGPSARLPGIDATATIQGAVTVPGHSNEVKAGTPTSAEDLGTGAFTMIDQTGGETIRLGAGAQTVLGSSGDTIFGGDAGHKVQEIDLTGSNGQTKAGAMTAIGGAGSLFVEAGMGDSIVGGSGPATVFGGGSSRGGEDRDMTPRGPGGETDDGRFANTVGGAADHPRGGGHGRMDDVNGSGIASGDTILGAQGPMTVLGGTGDSIAGQTGSLFVAGVTGSTVTAGAGGTTVMGGDGDTINGAAGGTLLVDIESRSKIHGNSPSMAGSGSETVDLGASHGATTLQDLSVPGGTGSLAATTVTGFSTMTDRIESRTSVRPSGDFIGTSSTTAQGTVLNFLDGSTMLLAGVFNINDVKFTR